MTTVPASRLAPVGVTVTVCGTSQFDASNESVAGAYCRIALSQSGGDASRWAAVLNAQLQFCSYGSSVTVWPAGGSDDSAIVYVPSPSMSPSAYGSTEAYAPVDQPAYGPTSATVYSSVCVRSIHSTSSVSVVMVSVTVCVAPMSTLDGSTNECTQCRWHQSSVGSSVVISTWPATPVFSSSDAVTLRRAGSLDTMLSLTLDA